MSCKGCKAKRVPGVRWLGVTWEGVPAPIRWIMPREIRRGLVGCGCIRPLKERFTKEIAVWDVAFRMMGGSSTGA